jgi:hypothetical protein
VLAVVVGLAVAVMLAGAAMVVVVLGHGDRSARSCVEQRRIDEAKVRTAAWHPADDLPDLGMYLEIHWQAHAMGDPCSRMPGPTDWTYQGVIRLRPEDAGTLAARFAWEPITAMASPAPPEPSIWPALAPVLAADVHWSRSHAYDTAPPQTRWREVYLDADRALLLFCPHDH